MFVEEIMLKKDGTLLKFSDGTMCRVVTEGDMKQTMRIAAIDLVEAGLLTIDDIEVDMIAKESSEVFPEHLDLGRGRCVEPQQPEELQLKSNEISTPEANVWCDKSTSYLLDQYEAYMDEVRPMKRFKNKKCIWEQISINFLVQKSLVKTAAQCENRFKTVKRRKTAASTINQTSGAKRVKVEYEDELNKVASRDDSIEPEILQGVDKIIVNTEKKISQKQSKPEQQRNKLANVLLRMHKEKQGAALKRHEEKMELLGNLAESLQQEDSLR